MFDEINRTVELTVLRFELTFQTTFGLRYKM